MFPSTKSGLWLVFLNRTTELRHLSTHYLTADNIVWDAPLAGQINFEEILNILFIFLIIDINFAIIWLRSRESHELMCARKCWLVEKFWRDMGDVGMDTDSLSLRCSMCGWDPVASWLCVKEKSITGSVVRVKNAYLLPLYASTSVTMSLASEDRLLLVSS